MKATLFGFVWAYSSRQQLTILAITCLAFPLVYMILEVPKWIINSAIEGHKFPVDVLGMELQQLPYLLVLSGFFLLLIVLNNAVKFVLNLYKGIVGERMLRRLRYQLYEASLTFRPRAFRKTSGDQLIPMITSEVEDLGHFVSEAVATPAFQGGSLIVYICFIFVQNVWLGLVAVSLYPLQAWLIPHLQRQVSLLARDRVRNLRVVADKVGSSVAGAESLHVDATRSHHLADFSDRLHENYIIRLQIYKKKFLIKFLNNFMNQVPPFIFYAVGGYFVIEGELSIGALVASIAAYQDISGPWKDLLGYYQRYAMSAIKYTTIMENFEPEDRFPESRFHVPDREEGTAIAALGLTLEAVALDSGSGSGLRDIGFAAEPGKSLALVGNDESGRTQLLQAIAGLLPLSAGRILLDGKTMSHVPEAELGRLIGYAAPGTYVFAGSLRDNLVYGLRGRQLGPSDLPETEQDFRAKEARLSGNAAVELNAPWIDYAQAGVADAKAMDKRLVALLIALGLGDELMQFGLERRLNPEDAPDFAARILKVRAALRLEIEADPELKAAVAFWEPEAINEAASLASNLLFGFPRRLGGGLFEVASDPDLRAVIEAEDLMDPLIALGAEAGDFLIAELLDHDPDSLPPDLQSPLGRDELERLRPTLAVYSREGLASLSQGQRLDLLALALGLQPARHKLTGLNADLRARLLQARARIHADWGRFEERYASFAADSYVASRDVGHNLLQGKVMHGQQAARDRLTAIIGPALEREGLLERIQRFGLARDVGVGGSALSAHQRYSVALARALVKRPALLIVDLGSGDAGLAERLRSLHAGTLVVGAETLAQAKTLDWACRIDHGRLVEQGAASELLETR